MKIAKRTSSGTMTLTLSGRLDTATSPELDAVVQKIETGVKELIFDFENLEYVSSAGLRVLLTAQKIMNARNGKMKIVKANDVIKEVFQVTGFASFITLA